MAIFRFPARTTLSLGLMALDFIFFTTLKHSESHPQFSFRFLYIIFNVVANHGLTNSSFRNFPFKL